MDERPVVLNELAQGLRTPAQGVGWFEAMAGDGQVEVLNLLTMYCLQARAVTEDGPESIRRAGIRPTHTPAVLVVRGRLPEQLAKIVGLPPDERVKSFRLLVALLAVADERRRALYCAGGCSHDWHHLEPQSGSTGRVEVSS
ncbi:DUF5958 family protein [Kitasatospora sp. NPDC051853]|uniref:DUF5958 family protein n=1 Tax=Kitasatospora sp. NPDC051853 TaxID=3364058 RepID=UPI0037AC2B4D